MGHWKGLSHILIIFVMLAAPDPSAARTDGVFEIHPAYLKQLRQEALTNNQSIQAERRRITALKEEARAAGAWDDPRIGLGLVNIPVDTFDLDQEPMTQKLVTLSQKLPWFGKLDLKSKKVTLSAAKLSLKLTTQEQALLRSLSDGYYELGYVSASLSINEQQTSHMAQIADIAAARYAAGKGLQQDVLQAQVEQSRLIEERNSLVRQRQVLEERINAMLNRQIFAPVAAPALTGLPQPGLSEAEVTRMALANNPALATLQVDMELSSVDVAIADKAYYPDPDIRLSYGQRDDDPSGRERSDFVSGTIVFSLPVWAKQKQGRQKEAALERREAARLQYQDLAVQLPFRVSTLLKELEQIRANHELYTRALVLQAEQWAESALAAYRVGRIEFNAMLSSQLRVLNLARQEKQYLYQYYRKMAALEELLGGGPPIASTTSPDLSRGE